MPNNIYRKKEIAFMEILVAPVENCLSNLIDDDACKVFSACFIDYPCDERAPWPCFFFAGCTANQ